MLEYLQLLVARVMALDSGLAVVAEGSATARDWGEEGGEQKGGPRARGRLRSGCAYAQEVAKWRAVGETKGLALWRTLSKNDAARRYRDRMG